ncbi:MAG: hypothetical protein R3F34_08125 [Planctomycetota bacterium]
MNGGDERGRVLESLRDVLRGGVGSVCWAVRGPSLATASEPASSTLLLAVGERIPRDEPYTEPGVPWALRTHFPSLAINTGGTAWRIVRAGRSVASWRYEAHDEGSVLEGVALLEGRRIESFRVFGPLHDLELRFEGDVALRLFGHRGRHERLDWFVRAGDLRIDVGPHGALRARR